MNDNRARELFIESLKEPLPAPEAAALAAHLAANPALSEELNGLREMFGALEADTALEKPGENAREALFAAIAAEQSAGPASGANPVAASAPARRPRSLFWLGSAAAACLLALAFLVGVRVGRASAQAAPSAPAVAGVAERISVDLAPDWEQTPAPVRMARILEGSDRESVAQLLSALAADPSVNVRLTAVYALNRHASNPNVRATMFASVNRDPSPIVQIAMIEFITTQGGPDAAPALARLAKNEAVDVAVRDAASYALAQL